jgi:hypothetical protein
MFQQATFCLSGAQWNIASRTTICGIEVVLSNVAKRSLMCHVPVCEANKWHGRHHYQDLLLLRYASQFESQI